MQGKPPRSNQASGDQASPTCGLLPKSSANPVFTRTLKPNVSTVTVNCLAEGETGAKRSVPSAVFGKGKAGAGPLILFNWR